MSKQKYVSKQIFLLMAENQVALLDAVKERLGLMTRSEVIRMAVGEFTQRITGSSYVPKRFGGLAPKPSKSDAKYFEQIAIAQQLGGEVIGKDGQEEVKFFIYEKVNPKLVEKHEQILPLSHLSRETLEKQYRPSRKDCFTILAKMAKTKKK